MKNDLQISLEKELLHLKQGGNLRVLPTLYPNSKKDVLNLSSNDYLGIAADKALHREFLSLISSDAIPRFSSSSSRLLTGNHQAYQETEEVLCHLFGSESALIFNSGYHMNIGILPAISTSNTLILADKLVHASLIDGIRLSKGKHIRYRHNDYEQLESLVKKYSVAFDKIIIVTESIFSMDGDLADLPRLVRMKKQYSNVYLYVDEAHAVGVRGQNGLGCAEEQNCLSEIDFLTGTFGKALASVGGYLICRAFIREYLINTMRPLIYTTALPPINLMWTKFVLERLTLFKNKRNQLNENRLLLKKLLTEKGYTCSSGSHIIPIIIGDSQSAIEKSEQLLRNGFYVLPIRPPTVPVGMARLRISLTADLTPENIHQIVQIV